MLKIVKNGGLFSVVDESDVVYGPQVSTRKEAEEVLASWKAYYAKGSHEQQNKARRAPTSV